MHIPLAFTRTPLMSVYWGHMIDQIKNLGAFGLAIVKIATNILNFCDYDQELKVLITGVEKSIRLTESGLLEMKNHEF